MTTHTEPRNGAASPDRGAITDSNQKTLDTIFSHPLAHNLEWRDVVTLIEKIGEVDRKANHEVTFVVGGARHRFHKPHTKDLAGPEVIEVRKFLQQAGWSPAEPPQPVAAASPPAPSLMAVVDHHEARLYSIAASSSGAPAFEIRPYDPHHFLHHLTHKDQSSEAGQRAPEDGSFYERIAQALSAADRIVVVGHGTGKSNAAHHLAEYLRSHHPGTHRRIASELVADLSSVSIPQLLELAQQALH